MPLNLEELTTEALELEMEARAELARRLLLSLDEFSESEIKTFGSKRLNGACKSFTMERLKAFQVTKCSAAPLRI